MLIVATFAERVNQPSARLCADSAAMQFSLQIAQCCFLLHVRGQGALLGVAGLPPRGGWTGAWCGPAEVGCRLRTPGWLNKEPQSYLIFLPGLNLGPSVLGKTNLEKGRHDFYAGKGEKGQYGQFSDAVLAALSWAQDLDNEGLGLERSLRRLLGNQRGKVSLALSVQGWL